MIWCSFCVCVCVCVCVRACARVCVCVCVRVRACVYMSDIRYWGAAIHCRYVEHGGRWVYTPQVGGGAVLISL